MWIGSHEKRGNDASGPLSWSTCRLGAILSVAIAGAAADGAAGAARVVVILIPNNQEVSTRKERRREDGREGKSRWSLLDEEHNKESKRKRSTRWTVGICDNPVHQTPLAQHMGEKKHKLGSSNAGTRNGWNLFLSQLRRPEAEVREQRRHDSQARYRLRFQGQQATAQGPSFPRTDKRRSCMIP
jgi:hypothetical protein